MPCHRGILWFHWFFLIALAAGVSLGFQGSRGLYETSEGRYAECAREMIESGNYLEPTLNYQPHWAKPPLTYWAIAGGIGLLGPGEAGVRLYNAVAFFLTTLVVALIGTTLWGRSSGWAAGLIYATSPFPVFGACAVTTDSLLTLWSACAVLCYLRACRSRKYAERWMNAMWVSLGLGFLTKGPPSLIPLIPIIIWHIRKRPGIRMATPAGIFLFLVTGFAWYLLSVIRHPDLLGYFLGKEIIDRISSGAVHNSRWYKPFTIYLPVLIFGAGPWAYLEFRLILEKRLIIPKNLWFYLRGGNEASFLLLWLLLPLVLFFVVKSRLPLYVLPLYPAIALSIARWISGNEGKALVLPKISRTALFAALILIALKGLMPLYPNKNDMKHLFDISRQFGADGSDVLTYNMSKLYGLQYYLDGHMKRLSLSGKEKWADGSLADLTGEIDGVEPQTSRLVISERNQAADLKEALKEERIPFRGYEDRYWVLFMIEKETKRTGYYQPRKSDCT